MLAAHFDVLGSKGHDLAELVLDLTNFLLPLLFEPICLIVQDIVDFGFEAGHVVAVVLLDDLLQLGLFALDLV